MFSNLKRTEDMAESTDFLGGGSYLLDSDIYKAQVVSAYADRFKSGAQYIQLKLKVTKADGSTQDYSERLTVTNKQGLVYYKGKDGKNHALPGYEMFEDLCLLTVGKLPSELDTEKKVLPIYNKDAQKEVPTECDCITELFGQEILAGIVQIRKNKQVADASGNYINSKDEQNVNELRKLFHPDYKTTVVEMRKLQATGADVSTLKPDFYNKWLEKNQGKVIDLYKEVVGSTGSTGFGGTTSAPASSNTMVFGRRIA